MPDYYDRRTTLSMDRSSKESLFAQNHPVIRELRTIQEILFDETLVHRENCLALKELFLKKNMDFYHVDCLVLRKIARHMLAIQEKLQKKGIFPGLYSLEDVYVNLEDTELPVFVIHPERFQLLDHQQEYEWYPEDERTFGDILLFDQETQAMADQRFLYKILIASSKGNVKVPPRASEQDYSSLFYGTLPPLWKEVFEREQLRTILWWKEQMDEAITAEEYYERKAREKIEPQSNQESEAVRTAAHSDLEKMVLHLILRSNPRESLKISRMLYEAQDQLEMEQSLGGFTLSQGFLYGDGVVKQRDFHSYPKEYRVQIPQNIAEYSVVEALLLGCEWMSEMLRTDGCDHRKQYRIYILTDGKVENNEMFHVCLNLIEEMKSKGCEIVLRMTKEASCEGWNRLQEKLERG